MRGVEAIALLADTARGAAGGLCPGKIATPAMTAGSQSPQPVLNYPKGKEAPMRRLVTKAIIFIALVALGKQSHEGHICHVPVALPPAMAGVRILQQNVQMA